MIYLVSQSRHVAPSVAVSSEFIFWELHEILSLLLMFFLSIFSSGELGMSIPR
jgi:hypothetical protein